MIDLLHESHNTLVPYPTMHHFVTEMCTYVYTSVTKCCIMGYFPDALWNLWGGSITPLQVKPLQIAWKKQGALCIILGMYRQCYRSKGMCWNSSQVFHYWLCLRSSWYCLVWPVMVKGSAYFLLEINKSACLVSSCIKDVLGASQVWL